MTGHIELPRGGRGLLHTENLYTLIGDTFSGSTAHDAHTASAVAATKAAAPADGRWLTRDVDRAGKENRSRDNAAASVNPIAG